MTPCTSQEMNLALVSKKKDLTKYMKEKELIDLNNQLLTIEQKYTYLPTDYHKYKYDDLIKYLEIKELNLWKQNLML